MSVQPQRFPDKGIKLSNQKIGQVKGREFIAFCEIFVAFKKGASNSEIWAEGEITLSTPEGKILEKMPAK